MIMHNFLFCDSFYRNGERLDNFPRQQQSSWTVPYVETMNIPLWSDSNVESEGPGGGQFRYEESVGYYWCEISSSNPVQRTTSEKVFVRYPGTVWKSRD